MIHSCLLGERDVADALRVPSLRLISLRGREVEAVRYTGRSSGLYHAILDIALFRDNGALRRLAAVQFWSWI